MILKKIKRVFSLLIILILPLCTKGQLSKPHNVLFVAIDDLNDYLNFMNGHPQAITPNFDRLSKECVVFSNAHCPSPKCTPSRSALMTGVYPHEEYVPVPLYFRDVPRLSNVVTLPQNFKENNYKTISIGKIFHHWVSDKVDIENSWDIHRDLHGDLTGYLSCCNFNPPQALPKENSILYSNSCMQENGYNIPEVGPINIATKDYYETKTANWISNRLNDIYVRNFFIAGGFLKPHIPHYAPEEWYDLYKDSTIIALTSDANIFDDIPLSAEKLAFRNQFKRHQECEILDELVKGYLANVAYIDYCIGLVLNALEQSIYRDNTILVIWSDHGHHLGEKEHFSKNTLWEESTRVPLIIKIPELENAYHFDEAPVNLMDLYATLNELCQLPKKDDIGGRSLVPLLENINNDWNYPSIITLDTFNHSIRTKEYRYTRYKDGSEELYNHLSDSKESNNLEADLSYAKTKAKLNSQLNDILNGGNGNLNELPRISWISSIGETYCIDTSNSNLSIPLEVEAYDIDGSIDSVEFWLNNELLSNLTEAPYSIDWNPTEIGEYTFTCIAFDDDLGKVYSRNNTIQVNGITNSTNEILNPLFKISPNPTSGKTCLQLMTNPLEIEIFDTSGFLRESFILENTAYIDLSNLSDGLYFIKAYDKILNQKQTKKVIKY